MVGGRPDSRSERLSGRLFRPARRQEQVGEIEAGRPGSGSPADPALGAAGRIRITPASHPAPHAVSPLANAAPPKLTNLQRMKYIESSIEELRPFLQRDGGDCELIDVEGDRVLVKLTGACVGCQLAAVTISGVQQMLIEMIGAPLRVIPVK